MAFFNQVWNNPGSTDGSNPNQSNFDRGFGRWNAQEFPHQKGPDFPQERQDFGTRNPWQRPNGSWENESFGVRLNNASHSQQMWPGGSDPSRGVLGRGPSLGPVPSPWQDANPFADIPRNVRGFGDGPMIKDDYEFRRSGGQKWGDSQRPDAVHQTVDAGFQDISFRQRSRSPIEGDFSKGNRPSRWDGGRERLQQKNLGGGGPKGPFGKNLGPGHQNTTQSNSHNQPDYDPNVDDTPNESHGGISMGEVIVRAQVARVKEHLNHNCGVLEIPSKGGRSLTAFFNSGCLHIPGHKGLTPFNKMYWRTNGEVSMREMFPVGQEVMVDAAKIDDNPYFDLMAVTIWPVEAEKPKQLPDNQKLRIRKQFLKELNKHLKHVKWNPSAISQQHSLVSENMNVDDASSFKLSTKLKNHFAIVLELLDNHSGILQDLGKHWKCFFSSDHMSLDQGENIKLLLHPGMKVCIDADLINAKKPIQYMASSVWTTLKFSKTTLATPVRHQALLSLYLSTNALVESRGTNCPTPVKVERYPSFFEGQIGVVSRLLDDNFGLIKVKDAQVLFDVCDFWLDPTRTASREGKRLKDVVRVNTKVVFHAALIEEDAIVQYLASSVWLQDSTDFNVHNRPPRIVRESIHREKIDIYRLVVKSIAKVIPSAVKAKEEPPTSSEKMAAGVVKTVIYKEGSIVGGVIEFGAKMYCFFVCDNCVQIPVDSIHPGFQLFFHSARISWSNKIQYVATALFSSTVEVAGVTQTEKMAKVEMSVARLEEIIKLLGANARELEDPSISMQPLINLPSSRANQANNGSRDLESYGYFHCVFSDDAGLLEDSEKKDNLIYFELSDMNITGATSLMDLVSHLGKCKVRYHASLLSESGSIRYVVHEKGVEVVGDLPKSLKGVVKVKVDPDEMIPVSFRNREKRQRFQEAKIKYENEEFETAEELKKGKIPYEELKHQTGVVRHVLNENFGLVRGPQGSRNRQQSFYSLFDTYDLFTSKQTTANDEGKNVCDVVKVGDVIMYNACLIEEDSVVPYLATAVWRPDDIKDGIEPMVKEAIHSDKVLIYRQVVDSCKSLLTPQPASTIKPELPELLKDINTTGVLSIELCDLFAILNLSSGHRALLSSHRVWKTNQQMKQGWQNLREVSGPISVNARRVRGFARFEYQVTFCHAGIEGRDERTQQFMYPDDMMDWLEFVGSEESMQEELGLYRSKHEAR